MDDIPPSYSQAVSRDHWQVVSPFIDSKDLYSAALVCRQWNRIFTPLLWGNPAAHLPIETVNDGLAVFAQIIVWARSSTRELTHTLCFESTHGEIRIELPRDWLREILARLPNLQSLIVSGLPFFDHGSFTSLAHSFTGLNSSYPIRLLDAESCFNTTSAGLASALKLFPNITYLNLSRTLPACNPLVFHALKHMRAIQILKLRGLHLRDDDIRIIVEAIGLRVRSLDVRDNRITDEGARNILQNCVMPSKRATAIARQNAVISSATTLGRHAYFGHDLPMVYKTEHQDCVIRQRLTTDFCHNLGIEVALGTGLTHLYISGNALSISSVAAILKLNRLHVLDIGTVVPATNRAEASHAARPVDDVESLLPLLESYGANVSYLRLRHDIITKPTAPLVEHTMPPVFSSSPPPQSHLRTIKNSTSIAPTSSEIHADHVARPSRTFLPSMMSQLQSLVLTDIPWHWSDYRAVDTIIEFISSCAEWSRWSKLQAKHAYDLPPGQARKYAERRHARSLFNFRRLVLEMAPRTPERIVRSDMADRSVAMSAVEDRDCDTFWQAASDDFSFFPEEYRRNAEEKVCRPAGVEAQRGRMSFNASSKVLPEYVSSVAASLPIINVDVLAELSKFRREKKAAYEVAIRRGEQDVYIQGHWEGDIVIVKPK